MSKARFRFLTRKVTFYRNRFFQPLWERLYKLSIYGMNYHAGFHKTNGELHVIKLIKKNFGEHPVIVDAGACLGEYSKSILSIIPEPEKIYIFEPLKNHFERIKENLPKAANIVLKNEGLSEIKERLILNYSKDIDPTASVYNNYHENKYSQEASFTTIDLLLEDEDVDCIDFLKIDTEGHELSILKGARKSIETGKIKAIQFEFGPYAIKSKSYFKDFYDFLNPNYRLFRIVNNGIMEIRDYTTYLERFFTSNFLAVSRGVEFDF